MNRETIKIKTPNGGQEVELNSWLTGKERKDINDVIFSSQKFTQEEAVAGKLNFSGELVGKMQEAQAKAFLVSIDGKKDENLYEALLAMRDKDYTFVMNKINELNQEETEIVKK